VRVKVAKGDLRYYLVPAPVVSKLGQGAKVVVNFDPFDGDRPAIISSPDGDFLGEASRWHVVSGDKQAEYSRIQAEYFRYFRELADAVCLPEAKNKKIGQATHEARKLEKARKAKDAVQPNRQRGDKKILQLFGGVANG